MACPFPSDNTVTFQSSHAALLREKLTPISTTINIVRTTARMRLLASHKSRAVSKLTKIDTRKSLVFSQYNTPNGISAKKSLTANT